MPMGFVGPGLGRAFKEAAVLILDPQVNGLGRKPLELGEKAKLRREEGEPDASQGRRRDRSRCFNNRRHLDKMQNDCA